MTFSYVHKEKTKAAVISLLQQQHEANNVAFPQTALDAAVAAVNALPDRTPAETDPVHVEVSTNGLIDVNNPDVCYVNTSARYVSIPNV